MLHSINISTYEFKYYIVFKSIENIHTILNYINLSFINSIDIRYYIAKLPSCLSEFLGEWPNVASYKIGQNDYNIQYIDSSRLSRVTLNSIRETMFGCIFIFDDVPNDVIELIMSISQIPCICVGKLKMGLLPFEQDTLQKIYDVFYKNLQKSMNLNKEVWQMPSEKTAIPCVRTSMFRYVRPLIYTIDRIRGRYFNIGDGSTQEKALSAHVERMDQASFTKNIQMLIERENLADSLIIDLLKLLICEKLLVYILCRINSGLTDNIKEKIEQIGLDWNEVLYLSKTNNQDTYINISNKMISNFDKIDSKIDMTINFPSVNYFRLINLWGKIIPKKIIREICSQQTYYGFFNSETMFAHDKSKENLNEKFLETLYQEMIYESQTYNSFFINLALSKRIPFIETRNIPSPEISRHLKEMSDFINRSDTNSVIHKFNERMEIISDIIKDINSIELWKIILKHSNHIWALTNMPIEWLKINKLPLCIEASISRVPAFISGGFIVNNQKAFLNRSTFKVLIVNALSTDDYLYKFGEQLADDISVLMNELNNQFVYSKPKCKKDFLNDIEKHKPTVLLFYGHGDHDYRHNTGQLFISKSDTVSSMELCGLKFKPTITILAACNTQKAFESGFNLSESFWTGGASVVIGTYFKVDGDYTKAFVYKLVKEILESIKSTGEQRVFFNELFFKVQKYFYILDPIYSLNERIKNTKKFDTDEIFIKFLNVADAHKYSDHECLVYREDIYSELFKGKSDNILDEYIKMITNDEIMPQSLFYTLVGIADNIVITNTSDPYHYF